MSEVIYQHTDEDGDTITLYDTGAVEIETKREGSVIAHATSKGSISDLIHTDSILRFGQAGSSGVWGLGVQRDAAKLLDEIKAAWLAHYTSLIIYQHTDEDGDTIRLYDTGGVAVQVGGDETETESSISDLQVHPTYSDMAGLPDRHVFGIDGSGQALVDAVRAAWLAHDTTTTEETDLKPRGVKRQWWLMPMDALARTYNADVGPKHITDALAGYQSDPGPNTAAVCFNSFLGCLVETMSQCEALDLVVQVFEHGSVKYTPDNWRNAAEDMDGFRREYYSGLCRHAWPKDGSPIDLDHVLSDGTEVKGSGFRHEAHGCCTSLMILWHEMDNRCL